MCFPAVFLVPILTLLAIHATPCQADSHQKESTLLGVEVRAEISESEIYLKDYCKIHETCVLTVDDLQFTFILDNSAYQIDVFDAGGSGSLISKAGTGNFYLLKDQEILDVELFSNTANGPIRIGKILMRKLVES